MLLRRRTAKLTPSNPRSLYRTQHYATAVYRSELSARLVELGYELERKEKGEFEIKGYTPAYLEASSPRRQQIKNYLEANGLSGAEAAEIAAHRTREPKRHLNPEHMRRLNLALAGEHGDDPLSVVAQARTRRQEMQSRPSSREEIFKIAHAALTFSRDRNMEREAVIDERTLLRDALARGQGQVRLGDIQTALRSRVRSNEFVRVRGDADTERLFTTAQMLAYERENLSTVARGQDLNDPLVRPEILRSLEEDFGKLTPAQRLATIRILEGRDRITGFQGVAGAGKTTALALVRRAAELDGYQAEGFAPTSHAAQQLESAGIPSTTLQHFLARSKKPDSEPKHLYVVDESSLVSTKQIHQFLKRLGPSDRMLLVATSVSTRQSRQGGPFSRCRKQA